MRFQRLRLQNFKCYRDAELHLNRGVTVIHGLNGSGKSSLLEACFFALYGAAALDRALEEVVAIGAEEATVELGFAHDGGDYLLRRRVRTTGERARTAECVLETPDTTVEGARDVRGYVSDLLRMDAEAFLNCAYVRQGEVNKLIDADAGERQDMIDDLLQLGKLEDYRERAVDARRGVQAVLGGQEDRIAELDSQIEAKEEKDLHERLNGLEGRLADLEETKERYEENRERARETLAEAEERIAAHEDQRERLRAVEADVEDLEAAIRETETERERVQEEISERRADREAAEDRVGDLLEATDLDGADPEAVAERIADLESEAEAVREDIEDRRVTVKEHTATAENERERAADLRERAAAKRETATENETEAERLESEAEEYREEASDLADRIEAEREAFADAPVAFGSADEQIERVEADLSEARERVSDCREALAPVGERIEEAQRLLEEGKCPECGQPVEGSPHVGALDELREERDELEGNLEAAREERDELEGKLEAARELAEVEATVADLESERDLAAERAGDREASAAEKREAAADLREEAEDLDAEAADASERAEEAAEAAEAAREEIGSLNGRRGDLRERIETLEALDDALEAVSEADAELERLTEKRELLTERNDERRERLADLREERRELREEYDEQRVEAARTEKERAESYLEDVEAELAALSDRRDRLVGAINRTEGEIEDLEELRERRAELAERVEALRSLHGEASDLETTYGELRGELRRRNVDTLERMLNETFELVYGNDSYTRIELDESYELTVYQRDGEPIQPDQLSGGERAVFNLSLRCAVYRLLAEGIEGSAPMPPLILDEPTVFLDSGHVSRLVDLVESMRSLGVEQILVVSHDEELVGAADDLVRVEKDPTSNRSTVRREELASA